MEYLNAKSQEENLWNDPKIAGAILKEKEELQCIFENQEDMEKELQSCYEFLNMIQDLSEQEGEEFLKDVVQIINDLDIKVNKERLKLLFSHPEDKKACFLSINAGSGGTEAQDWASMLTRMYLRWAQDNGYKGELLEESQGEEAGLKSATIKISGKSFPYGWLRGENGVHRLVRISPFDANSRRHTSFASVSVLPEIDDDIVVDIQEKDLRIDTYRASGAGGQHVNKTDSAIRITHIPTGIVVQCQIDRSQHRNRATAMAMLKSKLYVLGQEKIKAETDKHRGEERGITWGQQIRSYVLQPYQMVKDLRSGVESGNPQGVLDGDLHSFLLGFLEYEQTKKQEE